MREYVRVRDDVLLPRANPCFLADSDACSPGLFGGGRSDIHVSTYPTPVTQTEAVSSIHAHNHLPGLLTFTHTPPRAAMVRPTSARAAAALGLTAIALTLYLRYRNKQHGSGRRSSVAAARRRALPHLQKLLLPLSFDAEILEHSSRFVEGTRQWVFDDIERWRIAGVARCQVLLGGPGFGKSAIVSRYCVLHPEAVLAVHLCRHNDARKRDPHRLIRSLAYQIAQQLPAFQSALEEDLDAIGAELPSMTVHDIFDRLLLQPLATVAPPPTGAGRKLLVIDALDEAHHETRNLLLEVRSACHDARVPRCRPPCSRPAGTHVPPAVALPQACPATPPAATPPPPPLWPCAGADGHPRAAAP